MLFIWPCLNISPPDWFIPFRGYFLAIDRKLKFLCFGEKYIYLTYTGGEYQIGGDLINNVLLAGGLRDAVCILEIRNPNTPLVLNKMAIIYTQHSNHSSTNYSKVWRIAPFFLTTTPKCSAPHII